MTDNTADLKRTPFYDFHVQVGAKMVPFAGYEMPVQYKEGIIAEHKWTRQNAGLFDVSHMGLVKITSDKIPAAQAIEMVTVGDFEALGKGRQKYSYFTNEEGGILDDIMVSNYGDFFLMVVNAGCKDNDITMLKNEIGDKVKLEVLDDYALLALQGPKAREVLTAFNPAAADMGFMQVAEMDIMGQSCFVSCSGYTGEDGYEIAIPADKAWAFVKALLENPAVKMIGLGARDTLRLEAGLCLYGNDISTEVTPAMAGITFAISKKRREKADFKGAEIILGQMQNGISMRLVGLLPDSKAPLRSHMDILACDTHDNIGVITSGSFSPTLSAPIALALLDDAFAKEGSTVCVEVRDKTVQAKVVPLPFVPHHYRK